MKEQEKFEANKKAELKEVRAKNEILKKRAEKEGETYVDSGYEAYI